MYKVAEHLAQSGIDSRYTHYEWDDTHKRLGYAYGPARGELIQYLSGLHTRAKVSAAIGIYEWVAFRYHLLTEDEAPFLFAEAAWCGEVSYYYLNSAELSPLEWQGPVRGPLWAAITLLNEMIMFLSEDKEPALHAEWLSNLAMHVLPRTEEFVQWRDGFFARLKLLYTRSVDEGPFADLFSDGGGPLVAPQIVDLQREYMVESSVDLVRDFLEGVDYEKNPFLYSPQRMLEDGFEGVPYRL